ncbi:MAG: RluA family pseudouridine synthase [Ruminococcaceae bacterium]|nr:RluA family pseudouridine synthase [Oscillospiraceae bacterium]
MRTITINKNDAGQRLDKFLTKKFRTMPKSLMYKYIRTKYIKLNGKKCAIDNMLKEGDVLTFYIKDEFFEAQGDEYEFMKAPKKLSVVYEDENLIIIDKPEGVLSHPDKTYHFDSMVARVQHYLYDKGEYNPEAENSFSPAMANRLDRNTGGLIIAAKNAQALKELNRLIKERIIKKMYLCICEGTPKKSEGLLTGMLTKDEKKNKVSVKKNSDEGKEIATKYRVLHSSGKYSLVEVDLLTGRTHQIRAHMASIGTPLAGDTKYGGHPLRVKGHTGQALYSYKLIFGEVEESPLSYLSGKEFRARNIWFEKDGKVSI